MEELLNDAIKNAISKIERNNEFSLDIERRVTAHKKMLALFERVKLLDGGIFRSEDLAESIKIQKIVQNINPMVLPKLVGNFNYNVYFKNFKGTQTDFIKIHTELNGGTGYPGVDLESFSKDLSSLIKAQGNDFVKSFLKFEQYTGVGLAILSGYLYMFDPEKYPLINEASIGGTEFFIGKQHGSYIKKFCESEKEKLGITATIKSSTLRKYLAWRYVFETIKSNTSLNNYHEIDYFLWKTNKQKNRDRFFAISFGEDDLKKWSDYLQKGYHGILWDKLPDLSKQDDDEIENIFIKEYPDFSAKSRASQLYSIYKFRDLQKGDKIIANYGKSEILGAGEITKEYYYDADAKIGKHKVGVNWFNTTKKKIPEQSGWIATVKVISEGLFNGLLEYDEESKTPPEKIFTNEMFEWFKDLSNNPTKKFVDETKFKFNQYVHIPFKDFKDSVASQLDPEIKIKLETNKYVRSYILKNDYGMGQAYDYLWFGFYPKGSSRTKDAQLYFFMNKTEVRYGFFIGRYGEEAKNKFRNNVSKMKKEFLILLNNLFLKDELIPYYEDKQNQENIINHPFDEKQLDEWLEYDSIGISKSKSKDYAIKKGNLSDEVSNSFKLLFPIWRFAVDDFEELTGEETDDSVDDEAIYTKEQLEIDTFLSANEIANMEKELSRKKNIVLYGPPGTGKTYIAQRLAKYLAKGREDNIKYIQFHQSYSYEDFIEGIRPVSKLSKNENYIVEYPVVDGIFKSLCIKAQKFPDQNFVILIDEFNRGNISKIFGELLYLLEYRSETNSLILPYSKSSFFIPDKVFLIATMNTADKSLTHLDLALRRRFSFIRLDSNTEILEKWGAPRKLVLNSLIALIEEINDQIADENYSLGISYFMNEDLRGNLESIWRHEIIPYLKEYFIEDDSKKLDDFMWEKVKSKLDDILIK